MNSVSQTANNRDSSYQPQKPTNSEQTPQAKVMNCACLVCTYLFKEPQGPTASEQVPTTKPLPRTGVLLIDSASISNCFTYLSLPNDIKPGEELAAVPEWARKKWDEGKIKIQFITRNE
jgi:hypothetical protein